MLLSEAIKRAFKDKLSLKNEIARDFELQGLAPLESANECEACYIRDSKLSHELESKLQHCKAGAIFIQDSLYKALQDSISKETKDSIQSLSQDSLAKETKDSISNNTKESLAPNTQNLDSKNTHKNTQFLIVDNPHLAFALLSQLFRKSDFKEYPKTESNIDETANIASNVVFGKNVKVGKGTHIMPNVVIGDNVEIGENCVIYPNVVIYRDSRVGDRVLIHAGSVIGADGFGYAQTAKGEHEKIEHNGICVIEDDVEIHANNVIDRAVFGQTRVKRGSKVGHSCVIAHNSVVGEHSLLIAQVGLAGSTTMGRNVVLGGQVGTGGHVHIGDFTQVAGRGAVSKNLPPNTKWGGHPIMPLDSWMKFYVNLRRLLKEREDSK